MAETIWVILLELEQGGFVMKAGNNFVDPDFPEDNSKIKGVTWATSYEGISPFKSRRDAQAWLNQNKLQLQIEQVVHWPESEHLLK
jgi:hypothetical protein